MNINDLIEKKVLESGDSDEVKLFNVYKKIKNDEQITEKELDLHTVHLCNMLVYPILECSKDITRGGIIGTIIGTIIALARVAEKRTDYPIYTLLGKAIAAEAQDRMREGKLNG